MALPASELSRSDLAVIVPAFEFKRENSCKSWQYCAKLSFFPLSLP